MIKVKTVVRDSEVHGFGLFADQMIPKGTITWEYDPEYDVSFPSEKIECLPPVARAYMYYYCYFDKQLQKYVLCADGQRYINHSQKRLNIESTPTRDIAARDILPGEELLCDYRQFDNKYFERNGLSLEDIKE